MSTGSKILTDAYPANVIERDNASMMRGGGDLVS
jgi:hypothetical protein